MTEIIQYRPTGVCCQFMQIKINNGIVEDVEFIGGCNGNLQGIRALVKGMSIDDVIAKLKGIKCGGKSTSCPDQMAECLTSYQSSVSVSG